MGAINVDNEPGIEVLITEDFQREIREREFAFRFARDGEDALAALTANPNIELMLFNNIPVTDELALPHSLLDVGAAD
jgi:hypothetical protein